MAFGIANLSSAFAGNRIPDCLIQTLELDKQLESVNCARKPTDDPAPYHITGPKSDRLPLAQNKADTMARHVTLAAVVMT